MNISIIDTVKKIDKSTQEKVVGDHPLFSTSVDQYLKWTPGILIFVLDAAGVKTKNNSKDQLKIVAAAEAVLNAIIYPLKYTVREARPDNASSVKSFPSGHTATSFLGAEVLHQELKGNYPVASYSGFAIAAATGILRLYNNKHWLSDVISGAVIGVLSAKAAYWYFNKRKERKKAL